VFTDAAVRTAPHWADRAAAMASLGPAVALVARDPGASASDLSAFALRLLALAHPAEAGVIVSSRPDIAAGVGAQGVQLRDRDLSPVDARRVMPRGWIGRSVHSAAEGAEAVHEGVDYLVAGTIWPSASHPDRPAAGMGLIEALVPLGTPVIGIGGVNVERAQALRSAGAYGAAAISALWLAERPDAVAAAILEAWT
jgi:thiamine-phosphate diphosphorylase